MNPTICLTCIVKNEGKIISRLLDSVVGMVDEYVIVDTGSTDDTIEKIRNHSLPGTVLSAEFVDFGTTRTLGMEKARQMSRCDYLLFLDADMVLEWSERPARLTADAYSIVQKQGGLEYRNLRMVRRLLDARCVGVTHEYYDLPPGCTIDAMPDERMKIRDVSDGGCKDDKFERDARLLEMGLSEDPGNVRYVFYLAQTQLALGNCRRAISLYQQRSTMGGFQQEVDYTHHQIVHAFLTMGSLDEARAWEAAHPTPHTGETCYMICKHLRETSQHDLSFYYYLKGKRARRPGVGEVLFLEQAVYDYLLDYEASVLLFYLPLIPRSVGRDLCWSLLHREDLALDLRRSVVANLPFYLEPASPRKPYNVDMSRTPGVPEGYHSSTPSFVSLGTRPDADKKNGRMPDVITRMVSYKIRTDGSYDCPGDTVRTENVWVGKGALRVVVADEVAGHARADAMILGMEDIRVIRDVDDDRLLHVWGATGQFVGDAQICQVYGTINESDLTLTLRQVVKSPTGRPVEKNWVWVTQKRFVYEWYPRILLGTLDHDDDDDAGTVHLDEPSACTRSPAAFEGMRGSTNGVLHDGKWYFVTHSVLETSPPRRKYLHYVVVLDYHLTRIFKYTCPFTFGKDADIEYCIGIDVDDRGIVFGFSRVDHSSEILAVPWSEFMPSWTTCST